MELGRVQRAPFCPPFVPAECPAYPLRVRDVVGLSLPVGLRLFRPGHLGLAPSFGKATLLAGRQTGCDNSVPYRAPGSARREDPTTPSAGVLAIILPSTTRT